MLATITAVAITKADVVTRLVDAMLVGIAPIPRHAIVTIDELPSNILKCTERKLS